MLGLYTKSEHVYAKNDYIFLTNLYNMVFNFENSHCDQNAIILGNFQ